jgi:signal transduction histidine kinase
MGPVQRIEASANHLRHLVDQILDLAKMAAGRLEVHLENIDLRPFILDVASEVESLANEKRLHLSLALSASLPRLCTDPTHVRQILVNLIGNAVKYTNEGTIVIRARRVDPDETLIPPSLRSSETGKSQPPLWIIVQVTDTGVGIDPVDGERIFEEFEQVNAGPRSDSMRRGTGLGLPISRRLARLLGGDITLESVLGDGSTFTFWLPAESPTTKTSTTA